MKEDNNIFVPVLFIGFNRPEIVKQTFKYIRKAKPLKLYIAIDGPRNNNDEDTILVEQVIDLVRDIDWLCEANYRINDTNRGAEITISSAISWVLEKEEYVIVIEDDIIAPTSFLFFAQEMLERYKNESRVGLVSGCNFTPTDIIKTDYIFSKYGHIWGWATWKRVWEHYSLNLEVQKEHLRRDFLKKISNSRDEMKFYKTFFKRLLKNGKGNSTWDAVALYFMRYNDYLTIIPRLNLTSNIGTYGLHAKGLTKTHYMEYHENFIVNIHPSELQYDFAYDKFHFLTYINVKRSLFQRIIKRIRKDFFKWD